MSIYKAYPPADRYWDGDGEWHDDEPGSPVTPSAPGYPEAPDFFDANPPPAPAPSTPDRGFVSASQANSDLQALSNKYGVPLGSTDVSNYQGKAREDQAKYLADIEKQLQQRATNVPNQSSYVDARTVARPSGTGGGGTGGSGTGGAPSLLSDPSGNFYQPPLYASNPNAPTPPPLMAPYVAPTWTGGDFVEPTQAQVEGSYGYQTRRAAGQQVRERSAAAHGTVLNGGTQQALERYGQEFGSGEYQTFRGNAFQDYLTKYGQFVDKGNADFAARTENLAEQNTDYGRRVDAFDADNRRTLSDFTTNTSAQRNASSDYWNRLIDLYTGGGAAARGSYQSPA